MIISQVHGPTLSFVIVDGTISRFMTRENYTALGRANEFAEARAHEAASAHEKVSVATIDVASNEAAENAAARYVAGGQPSQAVPDKTTVSDKSPTDVVEEMFNKHGPDWVSNFDLFTEALPEGLRLRQEEMKKLVGEEKMREMHAMVAKNVDEIMEALFPGAHDKLREEYAAKQAPLNLGAAEAPAPQPATEDYPICPDCGNRHPRKPANLANTLARLFNQPNAPFVTRDSVTSQSTEVKAAVETLKQAAVDKVHPGMLLADYRKLHGEPQVITEVVANKPPTAQDLRTAIDKDPQPIEVNNGAQCKCPLPPLGSAWAWAGWICPQCNQKWEFGAKGGWIKFGTAVAKGVTGEIVKEMAKEAKGGQATIELQDEIKELKANYERACQTLAEMHAAAVGEVRGPGTNPVEDVRRVRQEMLHAQGVARQRAGGDPAVRDILLANVGSTEPEHLRNFFAQLNSEGSELQHLRLFKSYVHERLDKFGVPVDPEAQATRVNGCRIGGRLNWLFARSSNRVPISSPVPATAN